MQTLEQIPAEKLAELVIRSVYEGSEAGPGGTKVIPDSVQNLQRGTPPGGWTCTVVIDSPDGQDTLLVTYSPTDGYSDVVQGAGVEAKDDAADTYTPPKGAQGNAQQVLAWREEHGDEVKGMTAVGWTRARQLASGKPISLDTVKRMAQFNRHRKNSAVAPEHKGTPWKDAGRVAWLGWGGDTGINWAIGISGRADTTDDETLDAAEFTDKALHKQAVAWAKKTYSIWPSAYASGAMVSRYKKLYKAKHGTTEGAIKGDWLDIGPGLVHVDDLDFDELRGDNLEQWFAESWVRISSSGEILGECGGREEGEGKPKCLPRPRAEGMTKAARAAAVRRKREADPDPERQGQARNVATDEADTLPKPQPL